MKFAFILIIVILVLLPRIDAMRDVHACGQTLCPKVGGLRMCMLPWCEAKCRPIDCDDSCKANGEWSYGICGPSGCKCFCEQDICDHSCSKGQFGLCNAATNQCECQCSDEFCADNWYCNECQHEVAYCNTDTDHCDCDWISSDECDPEGDNACCANCYDACECWGTCASDTCEGYDECDCAEDMEWPTPSCDVSNGWFDDFCDKEYWFWGYPDPYWCIDQCAEYPVDPCDCVGDCDTVDDYCESAATCADDGSNCFCEWEAWNEAIEDCETTGNTNSFGYNCEQPGNSGYVSSECEDGSCVPGCDHDDCEEWCHRFWDGYVDSYYYQDGDYDECSNPEHPCPSYHCEHYWWGYQDGACFSMDGEVPDYPIPEDGDALWESDWDDLEGEGPGTSCHCYCNWD